MEATPNSDLARLSRDLKSLNAKPLWERTTRMGPGSPALPTIWRYQDMRPQLLRAIELISAKEAERRVLVLENPGLPGTRVAMHPGDFVLTPGWTWHDHGHLGSAPVIWLDALDNPFGQFFGAIFREDHPVDAQAVSHAAGDAAARYGSNLLPIEYRPGQRSSPLLVYPYDRTRETLDRLARSGPLHPAHGVKMRYINPIDGGYVYPTIAVFIQWLPKGFSGQTYRSTDGAVFNVVEGSGRVHIGDANFVFEPNDVFVVPPWTPYHLKIDNECVLFSYSDRAAQEALGFWREKDPSNSAARQ